MANSIGGVLWLDDNTHNALYDTPWDVPLALQRVELWTGGWDSHFVSYTQTDNAGRYSFDNLARGTYIIKFQWQDTWNLVSSGVARIISSDWAGLTLDSMASDVSNGYAQTGYIVVGYTSETQVTDANMGVLLVAGDDYSADTQTLGVAAGGITSGIINTVADRDWFQTFPLSAGHTYQIDMELNNMPILSLTGARVAVYDSNGTYVYVNSYNQTGGGPNTMLMFTPEQDGRYFIEVRGSSDGYLGDYRISIKDSSEPSDDYAATTRTTGLVAVNSAIVGNIETEGDNDWFKVTLDAGKRYQIDLEGSPTAQGTLTDTYIRGIYDRNGTEIASTRDDDSGTGMNSQLIFSPSSSGDYFIAAGAYSTRTGTYKLSVNLIEINDDYTQETDTTGVVTVGGSKTGVIEQSGDQDWFKVDLVAGQNYQIDLEGSPTNQGTLTDTYLRGIFNAQGVALNNTSDDDAGEGTNSKLTFTPDTTGSFYISAGAYNSHTGSYKLSVSALTQPTDDFSANPNTLGRVTVNQSAQGNIEQARDQDWFKVSLLAGHQYQIDLKGAPSNNGTLSDPYLKGIWASDDEILPYTENDDYNGLNSRVTFTPDANGDYYIAAGAYSSATGTYTLVVEEVPEIIDDGGMFVANTSLSSTDLLSNQDALFADRSNSTTSTDNNTSSSNPLASLLDQAIVL